jgi:hypothetical protein
VSTGNQVRLLDYTTIHPPLMSVMSASIPSSREGVWELDDALVTQLKAALIDFKAAQNLKVHSHNLKLH